jgi:hypothetical protein
MPFIGNKPTAVPLSSADLQDNIITSAKIVDGTIATADISDGAVTSVKTTGVGGNMKPSFYSTSSGNQSVASSTWTKVAINSEVFDTDNNYDPTTNYRFTPTTAGKYFIFSSIYWSGITDNILLLQVIRKNNVEQVINLKTSGRTDDHTLECFLIAEANGTTDYFEVYAMQQTGSNKNLASGNQRFGAYKIIE